MNNSHVTRTQILGIALLAAFVSAPVWAAPDPSPPAARNDLRVSNDDSYHTYRGKVEILLPDNEFNARIDGRIYKIYATDSTRDLRVGDPISIYGQLDRGVNIRYAKITKINDRDDNNRSNDRGNDNRDRDNNNRDRDNNNRDRNNNWRDRDNTDDRDIYIGEVTSIRNNRDFDVRCEGRTYRIFSNQSVRNLNRGDQVRISGNRSNYSDIRDARVNVLRDNDSDYRDASISYKGVVTAIHGSREFDFRVDGLIYNVSTERSVRGLSVGDEVRVSGRRFGDNDIREASANPSRSR